jgi:hypothetical protein
VAEGFHGFTVIMVISLLLCVLEKGSESAAKRDCSNKYVDYPTYAVSHKVVVELIT